MLCIKTKLKISKISGLGLFADQFIKKNTIVWRFDPSIDLLFSIENIEKLSLHSKKQMYNYAFLDKTHRKYMLCGDDARFFNHSDNPNCDDSLPDITIALRNIKVGEELTVNYNTFYEDIKNHPEIK